MRIAFLISIIVSSVVVHGSQIDLKDCTYVGKKEKRLFSKTTGNTVHVMVDQESMSGNATKNVNIDMTGFMDNDLTNDGTAVVYDDMSLYSGCKLMLEDGLTVGGTVTIFMPKNGSTSPHDIEMIECKLASMSGFQGLRLNRLILV